MSSSSRQSLRPVKVQVAGQTLALRSDASAAYLRELAAFVDGKLAEVRDAHFATTPGGPPRRPVSTQALALLCALQLADELRQSEGRGKQLRRQVLERTERILGHLAILDPDGASVTAGPAAAGGRRRARRIATPARRRAADRTVTPWR